MSVSELIILHSSDEILVNCHDAKKMTCDICSFHLNFQISFSFHLADVLLRVMIYYFLFHQDILTDKNTVTDILQDKNLAKPLIYSDIELILNLLKI